MANIGTKKKPIIVRVQTQERGLYGLAGAFEQKLTVSNLVVRMADLHSYQQRKLPIIIGIRGVGTVYFAFFK